MTPIPSREDVTRSRCPSGSDPTEDVTVDVALRRRSRPLLRTALSVLLVPALLAGCGGGASDLPDADLVVVGTDRLTWEPATLQAKAGTSTVAIVCEPGAPHNIVIEETGEELAACTPGRTAFGEVTLEAGTYVYVCTIPGHELTMRGVLEVR
jgi:plastocyanin